MSLWFSEDENDGNVRYSYKVRSVLYEGQSEFQHIRLLETESYGRMLVLDGYVMLTETDEFVYHEMISHVPMCLHRAPKRIAVIGGGDGGTVRELLRHDTVEEIVLCEIDGQVVDICKKYLPGVAGRLDDPRVHVRIGDGVEYIRSQRDAFDVIIIDSTDPIGPGEGLFTGEFYKAAATALRSSGLMVAQTESPWYPADLLRQIHGNIAAGFLHKKAYVGTVPTYPRGMWSWTLAGGDPIAPESFDRKRMDRIQDQLKYLTPNRLAAAFELPPFFREKVEP